MDEHEKLTETGVHYQPQETTNSFSDGAQCRIDAKLMAQLGANVIRVYAIESTQAASDCMKAFADEGIYVLCDIMTPAYYLRKVRTRAVMQEDTTLIRRRTIPSGR